MSKRRSLDEALSPEEEVFLKKGTSPKPKEKPRSKPTPPKEANMSRTALKQQEATLEAPIPAEAPRSFAATGTGASNGAINARIDPAITTALLRASLERRIAGINPHTQREIIAEALSDWLKRNGYI